MFYVISTPPRISVADFFLLPHRQNDGDIGVEAEPGNVAAVAEVNYPFQEFFGHVCHRATNVWLMRQHCHTLSDGFHNSFGCIEVLGREDAIETLHIEQRLR